MEALSASEPNTPGWRARRARGCFVPPTFSLENEQAVNVRRATKTRLVDVRVKGGEAALTKSSSAVAQ